MTIRQLHSHSVAAAEKEELKAETAVRGLWIMDPGSESRMGTVS